MRTDAELARLIAQEAPQLRLDRATLRRIDDGWDFDVVRVTAVWQGPAPVPAAEPVEWIFRFPRRAAVAAGLERELALLPTLAARLPVPVPRPAVVGRVGDARFMGYAALPGEAASAELLLGAHGGSLVDGLARTLAVLHHDVQPPPDAAAPATGAGERERHRTLLARARAVLPVPATVSAGWDAALDDDALWPDALALVHGDLGPPHVLVDGATGALTGLIDWTDARVADPALDFADLLTGFGPEVLDAVLAAYPGRAAPDRGFLDRVHFHASLGPVHTALFGVETGLSEYFDVGVRALAAQAG